MRIIRTWAPIVISLIAAGISAFALKQSYEASNSDELYKELSIAPVLELRYDFNDGIEIKAVNQGAGSAVIRRVSPSTISPSKRIFDTYGDRALERAQECKAMRYPSFATTNYFYVPSGAIRPSEAATIFKLFFLEADRKTAVKFSKEQSEMYYQCVDDTNIQLCCCSLSGKSCQMLTSRGYLENGFVCGNLVAAPETN